MVETRKMHSALFFVGHSCDFRFVYEAFALLTGEVCIGKKCTGDVCGRLEVHDDGTFVHRDDGKAIINGCTDGEKIATDSR